MTALALDVGHARVTARRAAAVAAMLVLLASAPVFLAPYATVTLTRVLIFALLAASLDLLVGLTGLPSLGHAAFFGVGAYAAGWCALHGVTSPVTFVVAAMASGLAALACGWIVVRSSGVFFLMLTVAIGEIAQQLAETWSSVTGGSNGMYGIPAGTLGGAELTMPAYVYWYVLAGFAAGMATLWSISASPLGAALRGIRDSEPRMRALGYETHRWKLAAFVLAGAVAGLSGALLAAQQRLVTPSDLGFTTSALALLAVVIGGGGKLWGACLGAALVIVVRDVAGVGLDGRGPLLLGLAFIAAVYVRSSLRSRG